MSTDPAPALPRPSDEALATLLDGSIAAFGIPMDPAWRPEALAYLRSIADAAHAVLAFDLGDEFDPAAVFRP